MAAKLHGPPGTGGAVSAVYWDEVKRGFVQKTDERRQSKAKQSKAKQSKAKISEKRIGLTFRASCNAELSSVGSSYPA
jgi:hypothetical protein